MKLCDGCGKEFLPLHANQKRCVKDCSRPSHGRGNDATRKAKRDLHEVTFIGVDGEGVTGVGYEDVWDDEEDELVTRQCDTHDYVLLSVGDQSLHKDGKVLSHLDIFPFLYDQFLANPKAAFVGYFLSYDYTHWLRSLSENKARKLLTKEGIASRQRKDSPNPTPWSVIVGKWEIDILANKRFKLRPYVKWEDKETRIVNHKDGTTSTKTISLPWMYICDAGPFFQTSFLTAIKPDKWKTPICTPEEYAVIEEGKKQRSDAEFDVDMIRYNILENEILARLMTTVNEGLVADHIHLDTDQWFGPGQAAQKWLKLIGTPSGEEVRDVTPLWALEAARDSYYGGWFEIFAHGLVEGTCYGYDINSAYPWGIADLPCLLHGTWTKGDAPLRKMPSRGLRLVYATLRGRDVRTGPAPFRRPDGSILRPLNAAGWYWWDELQAAKRAGLLTKIITHEWVEYTPRDCPPPVAAIRDLYEGRLSVGKNSPAGKGKKTIYNSSYGKFAQSIGKPIFSNPIYASRITSVCRSMILDAIAAHPGKTNDLLMVATDSVVFKTPHPNLDIDESRLGAWDESTHENLSLFMPGVYWDDSSREKIACGVAPELKSRGISSKDLLRMIGGLDAEWKKIDAQFNAMADAKWPSMKLKVDFQMVTAKQAVVRNAWDTCGKVDTKGFKKISANPGSKRDIYNNVCPIHPIHGYITSKPYVHAADAKGEVLAATTPYGRGFGMDDPETIFLSRNNEDPPTIGPDGDAMGLVQQALIPR